MIVNNRPDGEDAGQPPAPTSRRAAEASAGIAYRHVPIVRGMRPADVEAMRDAMQRRPATARCSPSAARATARRLAWAVAGREGVRARSWSARERAGIDLARSRICSSRYQGTTSPAAISSAAAPAEDRVAVREAAEALDDVVVLLA